MFDAGGGKNAMAESAHLPAQRSALRGALAEWQIKPDQGNYHDQ